MAPGVCETGSFTWRVGVDCAVAIRPDADTELLEFALLTTTAGDERTATPCHVRPAGVPGLIDGPAVSCPDIGIDDVTSGRRSVGIVGPWRTGTTVFEIDVEDTSAPWWLPPSTSATFGDRAVRWVVDPDTDPIDGTWVQLVPTFDDAWASSVAASELPIETDADGISRMVFRPEVAPGSYRLWFCDGEDPDTCERRPGGWAVQVMTADLVELIPGHNVADAERINVVFFGSDLAPIEVAAGFESIERTARSLLGWTGPTDAFVNARGDVLDEAPIRWGPFATEPIASNRHRFNLWFVAEPLDHVDALFLDVTDPGIHEGFDLANVHAVLMRADDRFGQSDARFASFTEVTEFPSAASQIVFGNTRMVLDTNNLSAAIQVLTHEWGHALFGLRDEYTELSRPIATGAPNCAPDEPTAEAWWGDRVGDVDPFVDVVIEQVQSFGRDPEIEFGGSLADQVRVATTPGGCYGALDDRSAFRPNRGSAMRETNPVFGTINRERIEAVLDLFSGWAPYRGLSDVGDDCGHDGASTVCVLALAPFVDAPPQGFAIDDLPCEAPQRDGRRWTARCVLPGVATTVTLTDGLDRRDVALARTTPTTASATDLATTIDVEAANDVIDDVDDGVPVAPIVLVGAGGLAVIGLLVAVRRSRVAT